MYQKIEIATGADVGEPAPLPVELFGLTADSLADLSWVDPALGFSGFGFVLVDPVVPSPTLLEVQAAKLAQLGANGRAILGAGFPTNGLHVQINDGSRADLGGMGATAGLVIANIIPTWPSDYARGWITIEGTRIPLATAQDGLILATGAGSYYSAVIQHAQDLEDEIKAAASIDAVNAIDVTVGWP